jgi:hypothetical protein
MTGLGFVALPIAAVAFLLGAQAPRMASQTKGSVLAAEVAGCLAYERNDVAGIRRFLADDYTLTDSKGLVTTKQDDIDDVVKIAFIIPAFGIEI